MSIVKMSKLSLAGHLSDRERIISKMMKLGLVEIVEFDSRNDEDTFTDCVKPDNDEERAVVYEQEMTRVEAAIEVIGRFCPYKKPMFYSGRNMRTDEYKTVVHEFERVWSVVAKLAEIDAKLVNLRAEENRQNSLCASLAPWRAMPLRLEESGTKTTVFTFGVLPASASLDGIAGTLSELAPESYIESVSSSQEFLYVVAVCHRECEEAMQSALKQYGFTRVQFKDQTGTPESIIDAAESRLADIAVNREDLVRQVKQLSAMRVSLEVLHDYLEIRMNRRRVVSKLGRSNSVFYLEGWLPTEFVDDFTSKISAEADCHLEFSEPEKGEDHPILLKNPAIIQPFEAITSMYSLPSTRDIDPNMLMAPFYFMFFGMMIGDFFYGLLLSLGVGIMIKKLKPVGTSGKILRMLFMGGLSTAFWGLMFGSFFGNLPQTVSGWITGVPNNEFYGLWFDPLSDPMKLLIFSMIFGLLHLFVGMAIKMYMLIKDGQVFAAIFDIGSWFILIIGLPLIALPGMVSGIPPMISTVGASMAILGALMLVLTQGRASKNPLKKLLDGVMSLYNITGYLSDVLSYSRLLALGLATGVIAAVINTLATLGAPGIVSFVVCLAVVAFGTVFNIAINALGAFVHSSRLQYVEFFSKFYEGGGVEFKPFRIKTKYVNVKTQYN